MTGKNMSDNDVVTYEIERYKALLDYAKQMTTLSTGSIVLIAGFIEKVFPDPHWKILTAVSLISFMLSILGAIVAHTMFIFDFPPRKNEAEEWESIVGGGGLVLAWCGFVIGIMSLAVFATKNLI